MPYRVTGFGPEWHPIRRKLSYGSPPIMLGPP